MSEEQFTQTLREYTKRKPYVPFIVELVDGERIYIDEPAVAFSGGTAGYLNESGELVRFSNRTVRLIGPATIQESK